MSGGGGFAGMESNVRESTYGVSVNVPLAHDEAVARTVEELKQEGFGVLTTIDVQQTMKQKLGREFRKYTILGACNPPLAYRAFTAELEIGLLLPCNLAVYETGPASSVVSAIAPGLALGMAGGKAELAEVAREAEARLRRALTRPESSAQATES